MGKLRPGLAKGLTHLETALETQESGIVTPRAPSQLPYYSTKAISIPSLKKDRWSVSSPTFLRLITRPHFPTTLYLLPSLLGELHHPELFGLS